MRKGNHNAFVSNEDGTFVGVNLGWDFTSEHEWGIKGLKRDFGIEGVKDGLLKKRLGIEACRVTVLPPHFKLFEKKGFTYLVSDHYRAEDEATKKDLDRMIEAYWTTYQKDAEEIVLQTAWDGDSFGIAAKGKEGRKYLKELYKAFDTNDAIITFGQDGNLFSNAGLMLLIASRLPQDYIDSCKEADLDQIALTKASDKTGIHKRLEKAGLRYFACSPRWANDEKTEVKYWLNPMEQKIHNSAWLTVAELDEWIAGKGPVMKESA